MPIKLIDHEEFCTIFDSSFLVLGLALYRSLLRVSPNAKLWVLAMDLKVEKQLEELNLESLEIVPLRAIETEELLEVKKTRSRGEYCWTLTPHFPKWLFENSKVQKRVTYLDADLFFFSTPVRIFQELEQAQKSVLITEHAYDPRYDQSEISGRFCVQFMVFNASQASLKILDWWATKCREWCFAKAESGKFGDQKYLDAWPEMFADDVHILNNKFLAQAPWNVEFAAKTVSNSSADMCFYHFHSFRFIKRGLVRDYAGYRIGKKFRNRIYGVYRSELSRIETEITNITANPPDLPFTSNSGLGRIKQLLRIAFRLESVSRLP